VDHDVRDGKAEIGCDLLSDRPAHDAAAPEIKRDREEHEPNSHRNETPPGTASGIRTS
jgi:hypothetical protein